VSFVVQDLVFPPAIPIHKSPDAVLEMHDVEVDQQTDRLPTQLEIGNDLGLVYGRNCLHRLDLDNDEIFDPQIHSITKSKLYPAIYNSQSNLDGRSNTRLQQFML
jgi:hypothetical protein